jgi:AraC-like DNA-binding protein
MSFLMEERLSDSPYVEMIWRGRAGSDYAPICPADGRWNLVFLTQNGKVRVSAEGPITRPKSKTLAEGTEWLVIKFQLGTFLPFLPVRHLLDREAILPEAAGASFWLHGSAWQFPGYENIETFVDRLVRHEALLRDPLVHAVLQAQLPDRSLRTVRRRFLFATGLTPKALEQIERAQKAASLLEQGVSLLDAAYQAGYADQPHMTRSLKRFIGYTPAHIAQMSTPE